MLDVVHKIALVGNFYLMIFEFCRFSLDLGGFLFEICGQIFKSYPSFCVQED